MRKSLKGIAEMQQAIELLDSHGIDIDRLSRLSNTQGSVGKAINAILQQILDESHGSPELNLNLRPPRRALKGPSKKKP